MNKPLYEYLENARKLENDIYACDISMVHLNDEIQKNKTLIKNAHTQFGLSYPMKPYLDKEPYFKNLPKERPKSDVPACIIGALLVSLIGSLVLTAIVIWLGMQVGFLSEDTCTKTFGIIFACLSILFSIVLMPFALIENKDAPIRYDNLKNSCEKKYQEDLQKHLEKYHELEKLRNQKIGKYKADLNNTLNSLYNSVNAINDTRNKLQNTLTEYYSANIVYPKYRGLIPITMFCEYIDSGRCDTLEGHEGAYNIYENELRQNIIITKLDGITNKLDSIKSSQYLLYNAITDANNISNRLVSSFSSYADQQAQANAMQLISNRAVVDSNNALKSLAEKNLEELRNLSK